MKTVLATLLSAAAVAAVGGAAFIYSGAFNVAANDPHWSLTYWVMDKARVRSIRARAAGLAPPTGYDEEAKVTGAAGHFSEHCAACHGGPGIKPAVWAEGMYPLPPNLKDVSSRYTPGELFWILKNGIKMSAMPSMASDGDEMLWNTVAFLEKLRTLSDDEFNDMWLAAQAAEGGTGGMTHGAMTGAGMDHGAMMNGAMGHGTMQTQGGATPPASPSSTPATEAESPSAVKRDGG